MDGSSPQSGRKRSHDDDGADERRVKRRNDDYRDGGRLRRRRSRSPRRPEHTDHRRRRHHHHRHRSRQDPPMELPCGARPLSRSADLDAFRLLFARYLDIQKQIDMAALDEREIRGRWKSFVGKWNNGELAEGWYQPETFEGVMLDSLAAGDETEGESIRSLEGGQDIANGRRRDSPAGQGRDTLPPRRAAARGDEGDATSRSRDTDEDDDDDDDDDDDYGPILPAQNGPRHSNPKTASEAKHGPSIPTIPDLALRREMEASERDEARVLLRQERRDERAQQKERLEELAPRAEAGSQARRLEKRRERREANATFANGRSANEIPDMADAELMGGGAGGGIEEYKRARKEAERKKTEREVRREEMLRAKREEREERAREYREREAQTVDMLREIAKARFG